MAKTLRMARPEWLAIAIVLQIGTYYADAVVWRTILARAGRPLPMRSFLGLELARQFVNQAIPSVGLSGTVLALRAFERRGVPRDATMAAAVIDLLAYYAAYMAALGGALAIVWLYGALIAPIAVPSLVFVAIAAGINGLVLVLVRLGRAPPGWVRRLPPLRPVVEALGAASLPLVRDTVLGALCFLLKLLVFALDAATLWALLRAIGSDQPAGAVFAAFMIASLARTIGIVPGGVGTFEAASIAILGLLGIPLAAGLTATLIFRALSFWLPLVPGMVIARHEARRA